MNSGAVVSSTVMVCVAEAVANIVGGGEGANDHVVAGGIAGGGFADTSMVTFRSCLTPWRRPSASRPSTLRCSRQGRR